MDQRAHLGDRQTVGPRWNVEHAVGLLVVVDALGLEIVAPDRNAAEVDGQRQLRFQFAGRLRQPERLGVVHQQAQHAFGLAVVAVLHDPLRLHPAQGAVGLADAVAEAVAPGLARRVVEVQRQRVAVRSGHTAHHVGKGRRTGLWGHAEEAVDLFVPVRVRTLHVALPHAQAAETACQVEQFAQALGFAARSGQLGPHRGQFSPCGVELGVQVRRGVGVLQRRGGLGSHRRR